MSTQGSKTAGGQGAGGAATTSLGSVVVDIRGKRLAIRTDHDPEFVQQLARYLDNKMRALQTQAPTAPFEKLLMLTSLNIAEELFEAQRELADVRAGLDARLSALQEI
ncbi:MAG: cell division protein ZapA, partial [Myxococcota bacterium]